MEPEPSKSSPSSKKKNKRSKGSSSSNPQQPMGSPCCSSSLLLGQQQQQLFSSSLSYPPVQNDNVKLVYPPMPKFVALDANSQLASEIDMAMFYLHKSVSEFRFEPTTAATAKRQPHQRKTNIDSEKSEKPNKIKKSSSSAMNNNQAYNYEPYWSQDKIDQAIANKSAIQGRLRINPRNFEDAFISDPVCGNGRSDLYLNGLVDRNRALNNDIVVAKIKEKYLWKILETFRNQALDTIIEFEAEHEHRIDTNLLRLVKSNPEFSRQRSSLSTSSNATEISNLPCSLIELAPLSYSNINLLGRLNDEWFQRTATVVAIVEKKNSRFAAGHLKLFADKNRDVALFSPNDSRMPRMKIKMSECPRDFYTNSHFYANSLFIARLVDVPMNSKYGDGELVKCIGKEGDMEVETEAILIENGIDYSEFDEKVNECLPTTPWSISSDELTYRRDFRSTCVFTIDPASARDLDDALHIVPLDGGDFQVGVHIADVSYFVREHTLVDKYACERTTSVYLVQKVIPMLPRLLCEHLCSLNPDTDRLTFSVVWRINADGDILEEWFGRSVINSAVKLSYEHAQSIIENPDKDFDIAEFPPIRQPFNLNDIKQSVLNLNKIAVKLRQKRFQNGCLVLNQAKINFILNKSTGMPYGFNIYQQKDSNRLVEEFMLLANIAVAHRIYAEFPEKAILRRHPPPDVKQLDQLGVLVKSYGFDCDVASSNSIQEFLSKIQSEDNLISLTLSCLLSKTMKLAQYFCSGSLGGKESKRDDFYHYGLAVPLYTHFTSPIRRYPDVLVHRLLAAALGYCELTARDVNYLQSLAETCNDKKMSARVCSERSAEIYFALFVNECGPLEEVAVVTQILDHSIDVLLVNLAISKRIYCDKIDIEKESIQYSKTGTRAELSFKWNANEKHPQKVEQTLVLFSTVSVVLTKSNENDPLKFNITLKHPNDELNRLDLNKTIENMPDESDILVNQRIDIDPYICD